MPTTSPPNKPTPQQLAAKQALMKQQMAEQQALKAKGSKRLKYRILFFILAFILAGFFIDLVTKAENRNALTEKTTTIYQDYILPKAEAILAKVNKTTSNDMEATLSVNLRNNGTILLNIPYIHKAYQRHHMQQGDLVLINNNYACANIDPKDFVSLVEVKNSSFGVYKPQIQFSPMLIEPLNQMMAAYQKSTGKRDVIVSSGFRTLEYQNNLFQTKAEAVGIEEAKFWVAPGGYSEHHTGLAIDLGTFSNDTLYSLDNQGSHSWFAKNCHRYGFIKRYSQNKTAITGVKEEYWHYRYVGKAHAYWIFKNGLAYEEYLAGIKNYTPAKPLFIQTDDNSNYAVYYVPESEFSQVKIPKIHDYEISGNNMDGFIVTIFLDQPARAKPAEEEPAEAEQPAAK